MSEDLVSRATDFTSLSAPEFQLASDASEDLYFTLEWFQNLSQHGIASGERPVLLVARSRTGAPAVCLPLRVELPSKSAVFGPCICSFSNFYSSLYGPIGNASELSEGAFKELARELRRLAPVLDLHPISLESDFIGHVARALRDEGWWVDQYFCFGNWHLPVNGRSFSEYERTLPSKLRNTIRRARKKLDAAGQWTISVAAAPGAELESAIDDWQAIYANSWKQPEPFPRFVPELCRMAARQGWLRLGVLRLDGTAVAAQIWFIRNRRAQIFKLAYDERYKPLSAGSVLSSDLMRRAIDIDGVVDVDYLTGDDNYKADWMSHRRERVGLVAFNAASIAGWASAARHFGGRWLRRRHFAPQATGGDCSDAAPTIVHPD